MHFIVTIKLKLLIQTLNFGKFYTFIKLASIISVFFIIRPYSPDMNPIEEAFGCSKSWLQKHPDVCTKYPKWCFEMALEKVYFMKI